MAVQNDTSGQSYFSLYFHRPIANHPQELDINLQ